MKLTTRGRYAVTAMLDLAIHSGDSPVALAEISKRQQISLSYLEQLFSNLRKYGLVESTRGPGGGYRLNGASESVVVSAIIDAVHESVDATSCGGQENCLNQSRCLTHDLWAGLNAQIDEFLSGVTLADLINKRPLQPIPLRREFKPKGKSPEVNIQSAAV
ncbi:MAG: Rrf2 family transcriptional regulator [Pseudomonadota bacterium]